jgi:hypothetical protein
MSPAREIVRVRYHNLFGNRQDGQYSHDFHPEFTLVLSLHVLEHHEEVYVAVVAHLTSGQGAEQESPAAVEPLHDALDDLRQPLVGPSTFVEKDLFVHVRHTLIVRARATMVKPPRRRSSTLSTSSLLRASELAGSVARWRWRP